MDEQQSTQSQTSDTSGQATNTAIQATVQTVDAAALAASQIAQVTGIASLEQAAQMILELERRITMLEPLIPAFRDLVLHVEQAASIAAESLPSGFVDRVESFFAKHFPMHAAPVQTDAAPVQTDAAKTE